MEAKFVVVTLSGIDAQSHDPGAGVEGHDRATSGNLLSRRPTMLSRKPMPQLLSSKPMHSRLLLLPLVPRSETLSRTRSSQRSQA